MEGNIDNIAIVSRYNVNVFNAVLSLTFCFFSFDSEPPEIKDVCSDLKSEGKLEDDSEGEQIENKTPKDGSGQLQVEQKEEEEESDEYEMEDEMEDEAVQSKMEDVTNGTPHQSASVVKYNVKTTPYLQR